MLAENRKARLPRIRLTPRLHWKRLPGEGFLHAQGQTRFLGKRRETDRTREGEFDERERVRGEREGKRERDRGREGERERGRERDSYTAQMHCAFCQNVTLGYWLL